MKKYFKKINCAALTAVLIVSISFSACDKKDKLVSNVNTEYTENILPDTHPPYVNIENAEVALELLKDGNVRYTSDKTAVKHNTSDREYFKDEQMPFAIIVACADSRVGPEIFLDQDLGDIFVIRCAGNIADETVLGSVEYAASNLNVPLIAVIGHSKCGAITAAVTDNGGKFSKNLAKIIDMVKSNIHSTDVESAVRENADSVAAQMRQNDVVVQHGVKVVSAYYDIETGVVDWGELS